MPLLCLFSVYPGNSGALVHLIHSFSAHLGNSDALQSFLCTSLPIRCILELRILPVLQIICAS